jgi:Arc/MetJ family transcription regulator
MARIRVEIDDDELLATAVALSEGLTKSEVVEEALREFIRHRAIEDFRNMLGNFELGLTHEELRRMREDE